jgi:UPF0755 protein
VLYKVIDSLFTSAIILVIGLTSVYIYIIDYQKSTVPNSKVLFIPKGSTKSVINHLNKNGYNLNRFDYYLIKQYGYPQAGWIDMQDENLSKRVFFKRLTHSKAVGIDIALIPGETTHIILEQIAKKFDLNVTKLHTFYTEISPYNEGVIFANTYTFYKGISEKKLIELLLKKSLLKHQELANKFLEKYDQKEWFTKHITIASIITKEAANKDEMSKVSSVIHNRLKIGMKLQMDGSLNYGKFSHKKVTPSMIRDDNSSYNTYKIKGLPPTPVCIVNSTSIKAAIYPSNTPYLYFVKKDSNSHAFSITYKEHLKNIKRY